MFLINHGYYLIILYLLRKCIQIKFSSLANSFTQNLDQPRQQEAMDRCQILNFYRFSMTSIPHAMRWGISVPTTVRVRRIFMELNSYLNVYIITVKTTQFLITKKLNNHISPCWFNETFYTDFLNRQIHFSSFISVISCKLLGQYNVH